MKKKNYNKTFCQNMHNKMLLIKYISLTLLRNKVIFFKNKYTKLILFLLKQYTMITNTIK